MGLGEVAPVAAALAVLAGAVDGLVEAAGSDLDLLEPMELVGFLQGVERVRNRLPVVDHAVLRVAGERDLAGVLGQGRLSRVLTQALRISAGEAARRVRAAEQLGDRRSMLGERQPPVRPVLAAAQQEGTVTPEQVEVVLRGLGKVDRAGYDPAEISLGEVTLTGLAATFGPKDLAVCVDRFVEHLDPDGSVPAEELTADRRLVELRPQRDGSWRGEFRLTGPLGAKLMAVLGPLARPRTNTVTGTDGRPVEEPDVRTYGQRLHDALEDVCDRLLRAGTLPDSGGTPVTVIVTIDEANLRSRTGTGSTTSDGARLSVAAVLELAEQAEIIPAVLNRSGAVLTLGRARRVASRLQTLALVARDAAAASPHARTRPSTANGTTSGPGCDPPRIPRIANPLGSARRKWGS